MRIKFTSIYAAFAVVVCLFFASILWSNYQSSRASQTEQQEMVNSNESGMRNSVPTFSETSSQRVAAPPASPPSSDYEIVPMETADEYKMRLIEVDAKLLAQKYDDFKKIALKNKGDYLDNLIYRLTVCTSKLKDNISNSQVDAKFSEDLKKQLLRFNEEQCGGLPSWIAADLTKLKEMAEKNGNVKFSDELVNSQAAELIEQKVMNLSPEQPVVRQLMSRAMSGNLESIRSILKLHQNDQIIWGDEVPISSISAAFAQYRNAAFDEDDANRFLRDLPDDQRERGVVAAKELFVKCCFKPAAKSQQELTQ